MKTYIKLNTLLAAIFLLAACHDHSHEEAGAHSHDNATTEETAHNDNQVHLSEQQFSALDMEIGNIEKRNVSPSVIANGQMLVPPQNEATVTAIIGANVKAINVIEGDKVKEGQVLAYISHPDLIKLQSDYVQSWSQLEYLENEYQRQQKLYEEKVGSGKNFQKVKSEYNAMKGMVKGYEAQLKLMNLSLGKIQNGDIYSQVPVVSPISGYVRLVEVKIGQYVQPQSPMFELVNIDHIHADLMVFEKDMHKVKKGQKVVFTVESLSGKEMEAEVYAVGKAFEQNPKAIHIHAEIENKEGLLIPGMYVRGKIIIDTLSGFALPEAAVAIEGEKSFAFTAQKNADTGEWLFSPIEIITGVKDNKWLEVKFLEPLDSKTKLAMNNAYYLMAEMKKEEAEHSH